MSVRSPIRRVSVEQKLERVRPHTLQEHAGGDPQPYHTLAIVEGRDEGKHPSQKDVVVVPSVASAVGKRAIKYEVRQNKQDTEEVLRKSVSCGNRSSFVGRRINPPRDQDRSGQDLEGQIQVVKKHHTDSYQQKNRHHVRRSRQVFFRIVKILEPVVLHESRRDESAFWWRVSVKRKGGGFQMFVGQKTNEPQ